MRVGLFIIIFEQNTSVNNKIKYRSMFIIHYTAVPIQISPKYFCLLHSLFSKLSLNFNVFNRVHSINNLFFSLKVYSKQTNEKNKIK